VFLGSIAMALLSRDQFQQRVDAESNVLLKLKGALQTLSDRLFKVEQQSQDATLSVQTEPATLKEEEEEDLQSTATSTENAPSSTETPSTGETQQSKSLFSLDTLKTEIEALRKSPPPYVTNIGDLKVPNMVCDTEKKLQRIDNGIWDITMCVTGSDENPAYNFPFLVNLRFDRSWPEVPPDVRFNCVMHHSLIDDEKCMVPPFYRAIPTVDRGETKVYTVESVVSQVHAFLVDPLPMIGVNPAQLPRHFLSHYHMHNEMSLERINVIQKYAERVLHKELFGSFESPPQMRQEWFDPAFWRAHQAGTTEAWRDLLHEELAGEVFSFPVFTMEFCQLLVEEIFNFYATGLPAKRPNSMNNYGIILNEIGLEPFVAELQKMFQPIGEIFFPGAGHVWDGNHCFIVRYREGEDLGLDMHTDDSDVTFNTCLGLDFDGAGLQFCGQMGAENHRKHTYTFHHKKGSCVCHLGRKRHGADDISRGERLNIILWNHSSTFRESLEYTDPDYAKEIGPPDEVCVSYTHDRDYGNFKEYPTGKEDFRGRGWCPPRQFEYDAFKAESKR
jgi:ubiquitin-protein ligase